MKGLAPLFLGIFGTFAFSWIGLTVIPTWQIGHLNPESDEEGTDIYPRPQSGMFTRGEHVYAANGCVYCHSQQVRADYIADDIERKWGNRRSAPRDYIFERPVFLGKMRMGQDLANIGARAPAPEESPAPAGAPQGAAVSSARGRRRTRRFTCNSAAQHPRVRRQQHPQRRLRPQPRQRRSPVHPRARPRRARRLRPELPLQEAALPHRARRLPARHGPSRQPVCRRCILPRGIMCIFMRRAASIPIQTCRRTVSSTKNDASPESVLQRRCNFQVPMRHRKAGRLFPRTMQNVLWLI